MVIPVLFRTYQPRGSPLDCKIWEAARATSATPTFFERIEIGRNQPFVDGGVGCNNPSQVVLHEAKALFGGARQIGCLVSIGTGQATVINMEKPGLFDKSIDTLKAISTDCEGTHEAMLRLFANLPNTYFRLNVEQGMQGVEFFEWAKLANVEAHTTQYMLKNEVDTTLAELANAVTVPKGVLPIEQLGMEESIL